MLPDTQAAQLRLQRPTQHAQHTTATTCGKHTHTQNAHTHTHSQTHARTTLNSLSLTHRHTQVRTHTQTQTCSSPPVDGVLHQLPDQHAGNKRRGQQAQRQAARGHAAPHEGSRDGQPQQRHHVPAARASGGGAGERDEGRRGEQAWPHTHAEQHPGAPETASPNNPQPAMHSNSSSRGRPPRAHRSPGRQPR